MLFKLLDPFRMVMLECLPLLERLREIYWVQKDLYQLHSWLMALVFIDLPPLLLPLLEKV
jgi:hypothetical protein